MLHAIDGLLTGLCEAVTITPTARDSVLCGSATLAGTEEQTVTYAVAFGPKQRDRTAATIPMRKQTF